MAGEHINVSIIIEEELGGTVWVPVKWDAVFPETNGNATRVKPLEVTNWNGDQFPSKEAAVQAAKQQAREAIRHMYGPISEEGITWEIRGARAGKKEAVEG